MSAYRSVNRRWLPMRLLFLLLVLCMVGVPSTVAQSVAVQAVDTVLTIGNVDAGPEPYLFFRVSSAMRLRNGDIAVANCGSGEVRVFDSAGRHVRTFGRAGEGPEEFRTLIRLFPANGDTIGAFDIGLWQVKLFTMDGSFVRVIQTRRSIHIRGRLANGDFIATLARPDRTLPRGAITRYPTWVLRLSPEGEVVDSIGPVPGGEALVFSDTGMTIGAPMGRALTLTTLGDHFAVGTQDRAEILLHGPDLRPFRALRTITSPAPFTDAEFRKFMDAAVEGMPPAGRATMEGTYGDGTRPESLPAYGTFRRGVDGVLWVQDGRRPEGEPTHWTAYRDGNAITRVELPTLFYPFEFGRNDVLGVAIDDVGVERVRLLQFVPRGAPAGPAFFRRTAVEATPCLGGLGG